MRSHKFEFPTETTTIIMAATSADENEVTAGFEAILSSLSSKSYNYRMPAEWEHHSACLILFPHNPDTFRVEKAAQEIAHLAMAIATTGQEPVYLLCKDATSAHIATKLIYSQNQQSDLPPIFTVVCPSNDTWARDTCPTFVLRRKNTHQKQELIGLDWNFNAYGGPVEGCYWPCTDDQKIASLVCSQTTQATSIGQSSTNSSTTSLAKSLSITASLPVPMILEGGSIHTDGEGTLLTTRECLLNPNRNPHMSRDQIESMLEVSLGIQKVLWLSFGLDADEDTNGHVDNFCCFVEPGHVLLAWTDVNDEPNEDGSPNNYQRCRMAQEYLQSMNDAKGRKIQITKLCLPYPCLRYTSEESESLGTDETIRNPYERMAASYINFYIANRAILVPQFATDDKDEELLKTDKMALETLQSVFPNRKAIGIPSKEILLGGGNIHCQTQQVPFI